ncbi:DUF4258 domain-containing protein [Bacteroidota bacterium]
MNLAKRSFYFFGGGIIGTIIVLFIAKQKNIQFPYGFDARTLKSIRVKPHRYFSEQAQNAVDTYGLDSIRIEYLLSESDVDFSESDTDVSKPCQKYKINGELKDMDVALVIKRCDSSATFEQIIITKK